MSDVADRESVPALFGGKGTEFSLISIGTRCIPKHTSGAGKKLPNKEPDSHNTGHEALFWASLCSDISADQALQAAHLRAFLAALTRIIHSHSAQRNNWGFSMLLIKSYLFSWILFEPLRSFQEWDSSSEVWCSSCCTKGFATSGRKDFNLPEEAKCPLPHWCGRLLEVTKENFGKQFCCSELSYLTKTFFSSSLFGCYFF